MRVGHKEQKTSWEVKGLAVVFSGLVLIKCRLTRRDGLVDCFLKYDVVFIMGTLFIARDTWIRFPETVMKKKKIWEVMEL